MSRAVIRGLCALILAACFGCAGIAVEEMPPDPIAVLHWDREAFRKREELLKGRNPSSTYREGVASVDALKRWLTSLSGTEAARELARYPGHLKLLNPRTGELTRLKQAPPGARPLAWSADHTHLLYTSAVGAGSFQVYEVDVESGEVAAITFGKETHIAADYARDGRIVFGGIVLDPKQPEGRIYTMEGSTALPKLVTRGALAETLRWSPSDDLLVYVIRQPARGEAEGRPVLVSQVLGVEGAVPRLLGAGRQPVFTPDGEWVIYSAPVRDTWKLRRMRPDASARRPLGSSVRDELSPAVSPGGDFVAYIGREGELDRIFVRRLDGTGERVVYADGAFAYPVW